MDAIFDGLLSEHEGETTLQLLPAHPRYRRGLQKLFERLEKHGSLKISLKSKNFKHEEGENFRPYYALILRLEEPAQSTRRPAHSKKTA